MGGNSLRWTATGTTVCTAVKCAPSPTTSALASTTTLPTPLTRSSLTSATSADATVTVRQGAGTWIVRGILTVSITGRRITTLRGGRMSVTCAFATRADELHAAAENVKTN